MNKDSHALIANEQVYITICVGENFKSIAWKAQYDMEFSSECLFCSSEKITGYRVEDELGHAGKIAICPTCEKVNAVYH
ncbi:hypothetical protein [Brevibacillus daliensis]|uniref:hypothetical protein n=1 Tax=Brevibacillus daliensis TaxID=2892995 RepID=UPI001E3A6952|nr:hypothetical protein [Brevibacillus daliensis]